MSTGKCDHLAYMIIPQTRILESNIPRSSLHHLSYTLLENLMDHLVCSIKCDSALKILATVPRKAVFTNEDPDFNTLMDCRFNCLHI